MSDPADVYQAVSEEVSTVLVGNEPIIERLTIAALTGGHVLLEGVPGVAKTTIADLFARALGLDFRRIQMTPDILPADITGTQMYREQTGEFQMQRGPVFANLVLADEINRATPKTQSALLEAMQERQVTIEGETLTLPTPFMVIATQNPIEYEGTFALPEAQRDRFQFKLVVDVPEAGDERTMLNRFDDEPGLGPESVSQVVEPDALLAARREVEEVHVSPKVKEYILSVISATRTASDIEYGASPRTSLMLLNAGKAHAAIRGREYALPADIKAIVPDVLRHRLVLNTDAVLSDRSIESVVDDILGMTPAPEAQLDVPQPDEQSLAGGETAGAEATEGADD